MNRKIVSAIALAGLLLLAGCAGISGSPELVWQGQQYQDTGLSTATIGYEGSMANTGDAPAKNVSVVLKVELQNGDVYRDVTYLGTIEDGDSKNWKVNLNVDEEDMEKDWDGADWTLIIRGDNFENQHNDLNK